MDQETLFLQAFDDYADALYRHAFFRLSDKEKAKDAVADAFTRTWDFVRKGGVVLDFKPFLYKTLNRLIIDEYRKKRTESLDALLDDDAVPEGAFPELVHGGREETEFLSDAKAIRPLFEEMPVGYRAVVMMRYMEGLSPKEIAELLGVSENVVSVRIHRGVDWLKREYTQKERKEKTKKSSKIKHESIR
jgi:RNA polymerase sigma-70 factor (ECF subfamily)